MIKKEQNINQIIIENQYFGTVNYINTLFQFSNVEIEQYESWQKMSFRNRCVVAGSNGLVHLSVPLEKGRSQKVLVRDVRISNSDDWQTRHLRTIESCYNRAPFFEFYRDAVWKLLEKKEVFLFDMNLSILEWLKTVLKIPATISLTDTYQKTVPENILDLRNYSLPKNYQQEPVGFRYTQVFEDRIGFMPNLSILDLLFCSGPAAKSLLKDNILTF